MGLVSVHEATQIPVSHFQGPAKRDARCEPYKLLFYSYSFFLFPFCVLGIGFLWAFAFVFGPRVLNRSSSQRAVVYPRQ